MKNAFTFGLITAFIVILLGIGAFYSPTFTQKMGYAQSILLVGELWFIASVLILVAALGFHTFSLFLSVLTTIAIVGFGVYGGFVVLSLVYLSWGFVFSLQLLLVHHHVLSAIDWFRERYTFADFQAEYRMFYPMLWILYVLLDLLPHLFFREPMDRFTPLKTLQYLQTILRP